MNSWMWLILAHVAEKLFQVYIFCSFCFHAAKLSYNLSLWHFDQLLCRLSDSILCSDLFSDSISLLCSCFLTNKQREVEMRSDVKKPSTAADRESLIKNLG